jgi:hypothetical protein
MHLHLISLVEDRVAELAQGPRHRWSTPARRPTGIAVTGRRALARLFLTVSLVSAAAVRRLDACLAEDLFTATPSPDGA